MGVIEVEWNRVKYVNDDTTLLEILPRNSMSILNLDVRDTNIYFFIEHCKMKLNPLKCTEMLINFMEYPITVIQHICIGNHHLGSVSAFKLLGVKVRHDLKWDDNID